eukprot:2475245-Rhodomonas_salina.4
MRAEVPIVVRGGLMSEKRARVAEKQAEQLVREGNAVVALEVFASESSTSHPGSEANLALISSRLEDLTVPPEEVESTGRSQGRARGTHTCLQAAGTPDYLAATNPHRYPRRQRPIMSSAPSQGAAGQPEGVTTAEVQLGQAEACATEMS